jgi:hypothetical protein
VTLDHLRPYLDLEGVCPDPVFIIGSPRSGTTALGHSLNRHPEFWASKECYLLNELYGNARVERTLERHWDRVTPSWLRAEGVERPELLGFLGLGINAMYSSRSDGLRWVDPTPLNTVIVDDVAEMFPGAWFLHLVRDGRRVVRSMGNFRQSLEETNGPIPDREMAPWTDDFDNACETWAEYAGIGLRFCEDHPERALTVRNEDLAADPAMGFARIFDFLGANPDPGPADFFSKRRINSSFRGERGGDNDPRQSAWSPDARQTFARIAGETLVVAGYLSSDELEAWVASGSEAATATPQRQ